MAPADPRNLRRYIVCSNGSFKLAHHFARKSIHVIERVATETAAREVHGFNDATNELRR